MSSEYKTTPKHFALFKKTVYVWLDHFGLKDWEIIISHDIPVSVDDAMGACGTDLAQRSCTIYLNKEWDVPVTDEFVKATAFHEVGELLLAPLDILARVTERMISPDEFDSAKHAIIARLYNSIAAEKYR